jgi:hypothetical protein
MGGRGGTGAVGGGRAGGGGGTANSSAIIPTEQRIRVPYSEYKDVYEKESHKVYYSYDSQNKTIEIDINPRIYEIAKIMPDSFYQQLLDGYKMGIKADSKEGKKQKAFYARVVYDRYRKIASKGGAMKKEAPEWQKKAFNIAVHGKK